MLISPKEINFSYTSYCDQNDTIEKSRSFSGHEWSRLTETIDYEVFKTINSNSCNVCLDGCDEVIKNHKRKQKSSN